MADGVASATVTFTNSSVRANAAHYGGGLFAEYGAMVNITSSSVHGNRANKDDGGLSIRPVLLLMIAA